MKEGWTYRKLREIAKVQNGFAFDSKLFNDVSKGIPLIRIRDIKRGFSKTYTTEVCDKDFFIRDGDLIIGMDGDFNVCLWKGGHAYLNQRVCHVIPSERVLSQYLYYLLPFPLQRINASTAFATVKHLSSKQVNDIDIPLPSLSEQRSIVSRLDAAFAEIDALKANAEKQLNEARALFQKALEEEMTPKEGWEEKTIIDVAKYRSGIAHEKVICDDGCFVVINSKFVSSDGKIKKYSNKQLAPLYKDDIVMVLSDVPKGKTLAKCYIIEQDNLYTLNQRICAFESKGIITRFLYYMLNRNPHLLGYDNGENQTNLRVKNVTECPVYYPNDKDTQQQIVARLDALSANIKKLEELQRKTLAECDALKQAMLREIFE